MRHPGHLAAALALSWLLASCDPRAGREASVPPSRPAPVTITGWRGDGSGIFPHVDPVLEWSEEKNVLWKTKVGSSFSSPVIAAGRVFVTSEKAKLVCVDAADGKVLWSAESGFDKLPADIRAKARQFPTDCGFATPTPVTDGCHVFVSYGTGVVTCFDLGGKRKWIRQFQLKPSTAEGRSASPVLAAGRLVVSITHLIALDPATGETIWEQKKAEAAYGTPVAAKIGDEAVIVTPTGRALRLSDGKVLLKDMAYADNTSPVVTGGVACFVGGSVVVAVRLPDKVADEAKPKELWYADAEGEFFSSPVVHDGLLYTMSNDGVLFIIEVKEGEIVFEDRLGNIPSASTPETANIYPSMAVAGGHVFVSNDAGTTLVLKPGRGYSEVAKNTLEEGAGGSHVFQGKRIYVRGGEFLYCIGEK